MPPDMTTDTTDQAALRMFPGAVVLPNAGCNRCQACQLLTSNGVGVITVHQASCSYRAE